jgi:hypothetical protein
VVNLRFTQSILGALKKVVAVGRQRRCIADERGGIAVTVPSLVTSEFRFTSATLF